MGLVIYDVFWVYFSQYIFTTNVMVRVATREAENPVGATRLPFLPACDAGTNLADRDCEKTQLSSVSRAPTFPAG